MTQAQLSIGNYTLPANRYLLYDCSQLLSEVTAADIDLSAGVGYYGYANFINYWMSAMKFFGLGIDRQNGCSTNRTQFNQCYKAAYAGTTPAAASNSYIIKQSHIVVPDVINPV